MPPVFSDVTNETLSKASVPVFPKVRRSATFCAALAAAVREPVYFTHSPLFLTSNETLPSDPPSAVSSAVSGPS